MLWGKCITVGHGQKTLKITMVEEYLSTKLKRQKHPNRIILESFFNLSDNNKYCIQFETHTL